MMPFQGYVARVYLSDPSHSFTPGAPGTAAAFLAESSYTDRTCPSPGATRRGSLWVITAISPQFQADLARYAACGGLSVQFQTQTGYVQIAHLVRNDATPRDTSSGHHSGGIGAPK